ncbi:MAG: hypothetical protein V8T30_04905 [Ruminococcus sp.]
MLEFETERQIPKLLNADCGMPVGAYSKVHERQNRAYDFHRLPKYCV